jgi:hypothetical protein
MFKFTVGNFLQLAQINYFQIPADQMMFFGLRGCIPLSDDSTEFKAEHVLTITSYDHIHPRCTLGQYHPLKGIALFPGSTVPHIKYIQNSVENSGKGANMLLTGYYTEYRKGIHHAGSSTAHQAFRQDGYLPVRRTSNDLNYDNNDPADYTRPYDNLHAAWSMGPDHDCFSSAGCQVVVGYPKCENRNNSPDTGPWKIFKENAYAIDQENFNYMLLTGLEAQKVAISQGNNISVRVRFGSKCYLVNTVQEKLKKLNYYTGDTDEDFGFHTLHALLRFQENYFGKDADDGIVGPMTASALKIKWPTEKLVN